MIDEFDLLKVIYMDIIELDLNQAICDILLNNKIKIVDDIVSCTEEEILHILEKKEYLDEVKGKLALFGLGFKHSKGHKNVAKTIEDLDLSLRTYIVLKRASINTVAELVYTDILKIRHLRNMVTLSFKEILLKLDEIGFNPIDAEIKKLEELRNSLELEKNRNTMIDPIEIENIKVNERSQLMITFSNVLKEEWIRNFKKVRARYFGYEHDGAEYIESTPKKTAKEIIKKVELTANTTTYCCSAENILNSEKYKEVLMYFIEYLKKILDLTQNEYAKSTKKALIKLKQIEIDEISRNIEFMKSVFLERDKIVAINNELDDLINKNTQKGTTK